MPTPPTPPSPAVPPADFASLTRLVRSASNGSDSPDLRRHMLADLCKLLGNRLQGKPTTPAPAPKASSPPPLPPLPPRTKAVLDLLITGLSEKQVAARLGISIHTVHVHVKALYKKLDVSSRAELLAKCLGGRGTEQ